MRGPVTLYGAQRAGFGGGGDDGTGELTEPFAFAKGQCGGAFHVDGSDEFVVSNDDFAGIINPGVAYEEVIDVGVGLFKHEVVRVVKVNVDGALRPCLN